MLKYTYRHRMKFLQYSVFGVGAFAFDLVLLYVAATFFAVPYYIAVPTAFVIATSTHYTLLRLFVYHESTRAIGKGYALFLAIMCTNAAVITLLVSGLVEYAQVGLYPARIGVGTVFGFLSFFLNSRYNFKLL
jgi:putative flippase GtrA